jgi:hypothetical protein
MRSLVEFLLDSKAETVMKGENEEQVVIAEINRLSSDWPLVTSPIEIGASTVLRLDFI